MKFLKVLLLILCFCCINSKATAQCTGVTEADSLWLVDFYNWTSGSNWKDNSNWLTGPVSSWYGIRVTDDGCNVQEIDMDGDPQFNGGGAGGNGLVGQIENIVLPRLYTFLVTYNELTGAIPPLDQVPSLGYFSFGVNDFTGTIPSLELVPESRFVLLSENPRMSGSLPDISGLSKLATFSASNLNLSGSISDLSNLSNLNSLSLYNNQFTFSHLLPAIESIPTSPSNLRYEDQDSIFRDTTITMLEGESLDLDLLVDEGLASNNHQWYKDEVLNGAPIQGNNNLTINNTSSSDAGVYRVEITNPNLPDLTLYSHEITVNVNRVTSCLEADSLWLVDFYNSTGGPNWTDNSNWLTGPVSSWYGITLTNDGCGLSGIVLSSNQLLGVIPSLNQTPNLGSFDVQNNQLSGNIPSLDQVPNLQFFLVNDNDLTGPIPSLDEVPELQTFRCSNNDLSGTIPVLSRTLKLSDFSCSENRFSGSIPSLSNLVLLKAFRCDENNLDGEIPNLSSLQSLRILFLSDNDYSGNFPPISNLENIDNLRINGNSFTFSNLISEATTFENQLQFFSYHPQDSIYQDTTITILVGQNIDLDLQVDEGLASNSYQWYKDGAILGAPIVGDNNLRIFSAAQTDAGVYRVEISNSQLPDLTLYSHDITINIQNNPCAAADSLWMVDLYNSSNGPSWTNNTNWLTTPISSWHGVLTNLDGCVEEINLTNNGLAGQLPEISGLSQLNWLVLSENQLTGTLPDLSSLSLTRLWLDSNRFVGPLPEFAQLQSSNLQSINLGFNQFEGEIPAISSLGRVEFLRLNDNNLTGPPPNPIRGSLMEVLLLQNNNLDGVFPPLDDNHLLRSLDFSGNSFTFNEILNALSTRDGRLTTLNYHPQDSIFKDTTITILEGENLDLDLLVDEGLASNSHQWYKDGIINGNPIQGDNNLTMNNITTSDVGVYRVEITNSNAPDLTLYSHEVAVNVTQRASCLEADSLWLVDFYNSTGGTNWNDNSNWLTGPVSSWFGITLTDDGCGVSVISLAQNNLTDTLPALDQVPNLETFSVFFNLLTGTIPSLDQVPNLVTFNVTRNQLSGNIPDLDLVPNLKFFNASGNQLKGSIPPLNRVPNLEGFLVWENQLTGSLPPLDQVPNLELFDVSNNQFLGSIPDLSQLVLLNRLFIGLNRFTFSDFLTPILSAQGQLSTFSYSPQDSIYQDTTISILEGGNLEVDLLVDEGLTSNSHQWYKNGIVHGAPIQGDNNLTLNNISIVDAGVYRVEITNPNAPDLTLYSHNVTVNVTPNASCLEADSLWLVDFYNSTDGPNWTDNSNWLTGSVNSWHGITLSIDGCSVQGINLKNNGLTGSLTSLALPNLERIYLDSNSLTQSIPILDQVPNLKEINLASNQLSGTMPVLNQVSQLEYFNVSYNQLTGPIPTLSLPELSTFICYWNQLSVELPTLDQVPKLEHFGVDHNQFIGGVPTLDQVPLLRIFAIQNNLLTGPLPALDQVPNLFDFSASDNQLSGPIPALDQVPFLNSFWVPNNNLSGPVSQIDQLPSLRAFVINQNNFEGDFSDLSVNTALDLLFVENNGFTFSNILSQIQSVQAQLTDLSYQPQDSIYRDTTINLTTGQSLDLDLLVDEGLATNIHQWYKDEAAFGTPIEGDNNLRITNAQVSDAGVYRVEITNPGLPDLTLYSHNITINVQPSCLEADSLWLVDFYNSTGGPNWTRNDNWLTGPVSTWYGITLTADGCGVKDILLGSNNLSGELISIELTALENFEVFFNELSGDIPLLNSVPNLKIFKAHSNQLSGEIPPLDAIPFLEVFWLADNNLINQIPPLTGLNSLKEIVLANNQISGSIPSLQDLQDLELLSLYNNSLSGEVPSINGLRRLKFVELDLNSLRGTFPSLADQDSLQVFDIAVNNFSGVLPDLSTKSQLFEVETGSNQFTFSNLLPQLTSLPATVTALGYHPQDSIYQDTTITIREGENLDLDLLVDEGLASNSYQWYKDGSISGPAISGDNNFRLTNAQVTDAGAYRVEIINSELPDLTLYSRTITIVIEPECNVTLASDPACEGTDEFIILRSQTDAQGVTYSWRAPNGSILVGANTDTLAVQVAGTYTVEVETASCNNSASAEAVWLTTRPSGLDDEYEFCPEEEELVLSPFNFDAYSWSEAGQLLSSSTFFEVDYEGVYTFEGLNTNGCLTTDTIEVFEYCEPDEIIIYNVMTPNGDGQGDYLTIEGISPNKEVRITVFNRWGRELYRFNGNYKNNWDGKLPNGGRLKPGNYLCVVKEGEREVSQVISVL